MKTDAAFVEELRHMLLALRAGEPERGKLAGRERVSVRVVLPNAQAIDEEEEDPPSKLPRRKRNGSPSTSARSV